MILYECRIMNGRTAIQSLAWFRYSSEEDAIAMASHICARREGDSVELWQGDKLIYCQVGEKGK